MGEVLNELYETFGRNIVSQSVASTEPPIFDWRKYPHTATVSLIREWRNNLSFQQFWDHTFLNTQEKIMNSITQGINN